MDPNDPWGQPEEVLPVPDTDSLPVWGQFPETYRPPPPSPPPINAPVGEKERFASLDVLRGTALFGILLVNIGAFAMVRDARYVPFVSGDELGLNYRAWQITFFGADTKFIQIFTMLFGAGIAVMHSRSRGRWLRRAPYYYLRMTFLLVLGLAHTFLLWDGDILYDYAVWGLFIYLIMWLPWPLMLVAAVWLLSVEAQIYAMNIVNRAVDYGDWERALFQGGYRSQLDWRLERWVIDGIAIPLFFRFQAVGHMLLGIVAYRTGFFTGRWYTWIYALGFVALAGTGLYFIGEGTQWRPGFNREEDALKFYWGSFALSLGYCAGLVCLAKAAPRAWITKGLAATGRLALTNYLMQTVICTTVFYGYGLGQFGKWPRFELLLFVIAVFVFQIVYSVIWLRYFQFGPMEWLWRSITYLKLQPLRRRTVVIVTESAAPEGLASPPDQDAGGFSSSPPRSM